MKAIFHFIRRISQMFGFELFVLPKLNVVAMIESELLSVIEKHLPITSETQCSVDIGASDGTSMSNTYSLYSKGWTGLAVEYDAVKFATLATRYQGFPQVQLAKCRVTPSNIVSLLTTHSVPRDFDFLSLDIDGYDYFVLEQLLSCYRPKLICAEINEKIPPPIKFTVKYDSSYNWNVDHFYGQSIAQLHSLAVKYKYSLVDLHYNNAFLVPSEFCSEPSLTPEEAYCLGYKDKTDRKEKWSLNADMEEVLHMEPEEALAFVIRYFKKYKGKFEISL